MSDPIAVPQDHVEQNENASKIEKNQGPMKQTARYRTVSSRYMSQSSSKLISQPNAISASTAKRPLSKPIQRSGVQPHHGKSGAKKPNDALPLRPITSNTVNATPFRRAALGDDDLPMNTPCPVPSLPSFKSSHSASLSLITPRSTSTTTASNLTRLNSSRSLPMTSRSKISPANAIRPKVHQTTPSTKVTQSPPSNAHTAQPKATPKGNGPSAKASVLAGKTKPGPSTTPKKKQAVSASQSALADPLLLLNLRMQYRLIYSILHPRYARRKVALQKEIVDMANKVLALRKQLQELKLQEVASQNEIKLSNVMKENNPWKQTVWDTVPETLQHVRRLMDVVRTLNERLYLQDINPGCDIEQNLQALSTRFKEKIATLRGENLDICELRDRQSARMTEIHEKIKGLEERMNTLRKTTEDAAIELSSRLYMQTMKRYAM